ncbi:MAG: hypothetical protein AB8B93_11710 [Pseudomonadales bacterium]
MANVVTLFNLLVALHVATGTVGLLSMWVPLLSRKGSKVHRQWGVVFYYALLLTGTLAVGISLCTLYAPLETHLFWDDAAKVRGVFGWMMLYLATMTINLAQYGRRCVRNRNSHANNRTTTNLMLQLATFVSAAFCAWQGWVLQMPLLAGIAIVGLAAGALNTRFILTEHVAKTEWLVQHTRGLVGAGISVYTAFLAFGAVNLLPQFAFSPLLWATPCTLGVSYLLYHQWRISSA